MCFVSLIFKLWESYYSFLWSLKVRTSNITITTVWNIISYHLVNSVATEATKHEAAFVLRVLPAMVGAMGGWGQRSFVRGGRQDELSLKGMGQRAACCITCQGPQTRKDDLRDHPLPCVLGIAVSAWEPLIWGSPESAHKCFLTLFLSSDFSSCHYKISQKKILP